MALDTNLVEFWRLTTNSLVGAFAGNVLSAAGGLTWDSTNSCWTITNTSNSYLVCNTLTLAQGFTVAAEVWVGGGAAGDYTLVGYLVESTNYWHIYQSGSSNLIKARSRSGGAAGDATGPGVTGAVWNKCAGVFATNTDRKAYLGGTLSAADTTSINVTGSSKFFTIGALFDGSTPTSGTGIGFRFRNVAVWSRTLTQSELDSYFANPSAVLGTDSTSPTTNGSLAIGTVTSNSIQVSWSAGSDNVGVTSYETSLDGVTWTDRGNVLTYTFTGLTPSTSYTPRMRAKDAAGNVSSVLSATQSTSASSDSTAPTMTGSISATSITQTTYTLSWSAASDNVGVAGYEVSLDNGSTWTDNGASTTRDVTGRTAGATDSVRVRAYDAAGNRATPLTATVPLAAAPLGTIAGDVIKSPTGIVQALVTIPKVSFIRMSDMTTVLSLADQVTNGSGMLPISNAALVAGVKYLRVLADATGANVGIAAYTAS